MIIEIHDRELAEDEALSRALALTQRHQHVERCDIFVQPRVPLDAPDYKYPGWLEYGVLMKYETGGQLYVAVIQRRPGESYETHS
jgi:hypothetical protein